MNGSIIEVAQLQPFPSGFAVAFVGAEGPIPTDMPNLLLEPAVQKQPKGKPGKAVEGKGTAQGHAQGHATGEAQAQAKQEQEQYAGQEQAPNQEQDKEHGARGGARSRRGVPPRI